MREYPRVDFYRPVVSLIAQLTILKYEIES